MPLQIHDIEIADSSQLQNQDRIVLGQQFNVPFTSSGSAGAQTFAVSFAAGSLPNGYAVQVTPTVAMFTSVPSASKTNSGFNVVLTPPLIGSTLASGTFDVIVVG